MYLSALAAMFVHDGAVNPGRKPFTVSCKRSGKWLGLVADNVAVYVVAVVMFWYADTRSRELDWLANIVFAKFSAGVFVTPSVPIAVSTSLAT